MVGHHFDELTHSLTPSRRSLLTSAIMLAASWLGIASASAKKKGKHKKKGKKKTQTTPQQPVINQFGCADVGQPCHGDSSLCCSGVCAGTPPKKGKPDARVCAAHGAGTCDQAGPDICTTADQDSIICDTRPWCHCIRTTAGSTYCATTVATTCAVCQRDADCEALGFPPGSACMPTSEAYCAGDCPQNTACAVPCSPVPPEA